MIIAKKKSVGAESAKTLAQRGANKLVNQGTTMRRSWIYSFLFKVPDRIAPCEPLRKGRHGT